MLGVMDLGLALLEPKLDALEGDSFVSIVAKFGKFRTGK